MPKIRDPALLSRLRLMPVRRLAAGGRWRVEAPHSRPEALLLWITRGQGRIMLAGTRRGYTAHNAILVPGGTMHSLELGDNVQGTALFFGRYSDLALPEEPLHLRVRDAHAQAQLNMLVDSLSRELRADLVGKERAVTHHLGLLSVLIERLAADERAAKDASPPSAAERLVARYATLVERDYRSGAGVGDFAAQLGITPTHLSRCCNATCGRSALALLHERRLFEARRLLAETPIPIRHVALSLGFGSAAHFSRAFREETGQAPRDFRRDARRLSPANA